MHWYRKTVVEQISDESLLAYIAEFDPDPDVRIAAIKAVKRTGPGHSAGERSLTRCTPGSHSECNQ